MMRLMTGDSGSLITPLTTQTLGYIGANNEGQNSPAYNIELGGSGRVIHGTDSGTITLTDGDDLTVALAKIGYLYTARYGTDTINAGWTFAPTSSTSFGNSPIFDKTGANPPFSVTSTTATVVTNLDVDKLDGYHASNATGDIPINNGTVNTNLNADYLDGIHASTTPVANKLIAADAAGFPQTPLSAPTTNYQAANKKYVDDSIPSLAGIVRTTGDQTIAGIKTFTSTINANISGYATKLYNYIPANWANGEPGSSITIDIRPLALVSFYGTLSSHGSVILSWSDPNIIRVVDCLHITLFDGTYWQYFNVNGWDVYRSDGTTYVYFDSSDNDYAGAEYRMTVLVELAN